MPSLLITCLTLIPIALAFEDINLDTYTGTQVTSIYGVGPNHYLGHSLSYIGDFNGDKVDDLIIGAPHLVGQTTNLGWVYIVFGVKGQMSNINIAQSFTTGVQGFRIRGNDVGDYFGWSVSGAGDVNGDGIDDVIIGAQRYRFEAGTLWRNDPGVTYIIFGRKTGFSDILLANPLPVDQGFKVVSTTPGNHFGSAVSNIGDINGDGINDFMIGAYAESPFGKTGAGTVFVIFGRKTGFTGDIDLANGLSNSKGFQIYGENAGDNLGYAVKYAGDVNDDGISDIIIGALRAGSPGTNPGIVYVIFGHKGDWSDINLADGLTITQGFTIQGTSAVNEQATPLSSAGDLNGDGVSDFVVGAGLNTNPFSGDPTGTVYIIYGTPLAGKQLLETLANVQSIGQLATTVAAKIIALINFSNAGALWFGFLAEILKYMRYMKLKYPSRLQFILDQPDPELISIPYISDPPQEVQDSIPTYQIMDKFEIFGYDSSFLINFWTSLMTIGIILILIMLFVILAAITKSVKKIHVVFDKVKQALKWNYFVATFSGFYNDIALCTALEITTVHFSSFLEILSFSFCVAVNVLAFFILVMMGIVLKRLGKGRNKNEEANKDEVTGKVVTSGLIDYQIVFDSFKDNSFAHQGYMLVFCIRLYLFYTVIAYLYSYPLVQAIIINVLSIIILSYLIIFRPFRSKLDLISSFLQELILELVNACVLAFCFYDPNDPEDEDARTTLGDIIVGSNTAFMAVGVVYIFITTVLLIGDLAKLVVEKCSKKTAIHPVIKPEEPEGSQEPDRQISEDSFVFDRSSLGLIPNTRDVSQYSSSSRLKIDTSVNMSSNGFIPLREFNFTSTRASQKSIAIDLKASYKQSDKGSLSDQVKRRKV